MYLLAALLLLFTSHVVRSGEQAEHRDFQYNSVVDPKTGRYNFAYDTGNENDNEIAHTMHMQYRDANGMVRGRYGYTDPNGKLRVVEYEAGPNGFVARGDVGPDSFPHDQTPETRVSQVARYSQEEDLDLDPRPVQMAGWDPLQDPMGQPVSSTSAGSPSQVENEADAGGSNLNGYSTTNTTSSDRESVYIASADPYDDRYPRLPISTNENPNGRELESLNSQTIGDESKSEMNEGYPVAAPLNVNNIDVNPNDIRAAASGRVLTARSTDGDTTSRSARVLPYSYRNYLRQTHDHDGEIVTGYRSIYIPSHGHYHYVKQPHDHDAERRYYVVNRQTHDHDAERRYASNRQTHDHDAEIRRYYRNRQTHDHDAERRYYAYRRAHYNNDDVAHTLYHQNNPDRRRIYYKDSHSNVPHEHYNDIYHNDHDRSHQHSDVHLYGRSQSLEVPPTAQPGQLKYISSDKYHDKYYFWTD